MLKFNSNTLSKTLYRIRKAYIFSHLDKFEDVSGSSACKTLENLLGRANIHAGTVILVERAHPNPFLTFSGQRHVLRNQVDNICRLTDLVL
jgi:hypothetical protein